ncbi:facilitated trehalose transporter Tret1-like [Contarinia nasturtii]|uniref:facilitated trehalose transporter Tret1-like n=1 Tax=Contarinia nasturtii TaxID=265458 RepID=UPI0012D4962F|nr:facilitated trehalose transporter Tret1-like [Contarinia nasturtii]
MEAENMEIPGNVNGLEFSSKVNMIEVKTSRLRTSLPQIIVSLVTTLLLFDLGVSIAYPTVLISALTGLNNKTNPNELLRMTAVEASWMGSISYLGKLVGSLICGLSCELLGHRSSMILINFPHLVAFYLFYYSTSIWKVFVANILLGFGAGFIKAPCTTYVSETSEASIRGVLVSMTSISLTVAPLIIFSLGNLTQWRNIALYCSILQIVTTILLLFLPESPMWLLSKQRDETALKALRWLRGWVPQNLVQTEYDSIKRYKANSNSCANCKKSSIECTHLSAQTTQQAIRELIRKRTLKPFFILLVMGFVSYFSGSHHLTPYIPQILNTYRSPMSPNWATVVVATIGMTGTFGGIVGMKVLGKRQLYLVSLSGVTLCGLILSIYGFIYLPMNSKSFEHKNVIESESSSIPLIVCCVMRFFTTISLMVPFTMLSELFSLKSRSMATGVVVSLNNIFIFTATKSFYNLEHWFDLPSTLGIYCAIGAIGLVVTFLILPETEGTSLEDIEIHFSDNSRKLTDRYIARQSEK